MVIYDESFVGFNWDILIKIIWSYWVLLFDWYLYYWVICGNEWDIMVLIQILFKNNK